MASVSASHLIIFIASLVIAAGVVGTLTTGVDRVSSAIDDRSLDVSQQVRMDMAIISDPGNAAYDSGNNLTIHVRNTGSQGVPIENAEAVDIVLNGKFVGNGDLTITDANEGASNVWRPGDVVEIIIDNDGDSYNIESTVDNRLILTVNEDEETFEFTT